MSESPAKATVETTTRSAGPPPASPLRLWMADAVLVGALTVTAWQRIDGDDGTGFSAGASIAITVVSLLLGVAGVVASRHDRAGWAAAGLFLATTMSLSAIPLLHVVGGLLAVVELVRAVLNRRRHR